ncbi:MAG TPA: GNAT family N-acetyltransferase [Solirubrobacterales bacterium]|nr:GNAT family N-acetyltransferase [Solirubrobacterales bacterium]
MRPSGLGNRTSTTASAVATDRPGSAEAEAWLEQHRHERDGSWQKFVRDVSEPDLPTMPGIEVLELGMDEGEGMSAIAAEGLGLPEWAGTLFFDLPARPNWHCYVALLEGSLASCGAMMVSDGIAELGVDATLPEARGRGCQLALLRHRMTVAAELGCETLLAEVGCAGGELATVRGNLRHAGFESAYESHIWRLSRSLGIY